MTDEQIETLAVKHESFGFGQVDAKGLTIHGFDPDGLSAFVTELLASRDAEIVALNSQVERLQAILARRLIGLCKCKEERDQLNKQVTLLRDALLYERSLYLEAGSDMEEQGLESLAATEPTK